MMDSVCRFSASSRCGREGQRHLGVSAVGARAVGTAWGAGVRCRAEASAACDGQPAHQPAASSAHPALFLRRFPQTLVLCRLLLLLHHFLAPLPVVLERHDHDAHLRKAGAGGWPWAAVRSWQLGGLGGHGWHNNARRCSRQALQPRVP
jgi:hypothetical protein